MRFTHKELQESVGRKRWTISRWNRLGAFGELSWPTRAGQPHGQRVFTPEHVERAKFILVCVEAKIPVREIGRLKPIEWAKEGACVNSKAWTVRKVLEVLAVADELDKGVSLKTIARRRARARERKRSQ